MDTYSYETEEALAGLMALFGVGSMFMVWVVLILGFILFFLALGIIFGIPYYKMAKKAELPHAWLAFVPIGFYYVALNLPAREFNIFNWIKTRDRMKVFWYYLISFPAISVISTIIGVLAAIPLIGIIFMVLSYLISIVYSVAAYVFMWRVYYDILMTYGMEENAMLLSVLNCFFPIIMPVCSFIIMNREPNYNI